MYMYMVRERERVTLILHAILISVLDQCMLNSAI